MDAEQALPLWDALMEAGRAYDITPTGMLALDVARIEAGLILLDVDYTSAKKALIPSQKYSPVRDRPGPAGQPGEGALHRPGGAAARGRGGRASAQLVGLDVSWDDVERLHDEAGLAPQIPLTASRVSVPSTGTASRSGKATSTTWSPTLKKMIALATVARDAALPGTRAARWSSPSTTERREVGAVVAEAALLRPASQARLSEPGNRGCSAARPGRDGR